MPDPVLVIHFTQGTSIAGAVNAMRAAKSESHEVVDPAKADANGYALTQQLLPWTTPARSLKHPTGTPDTNNRGWAASSQLGRCYQVEIVGYSETAAIYPDDWYARLAAYLRARCEALGVPYRFPCQFTGIQGYGASAGQRLTWAAWATVAGIVGHSHVPGNEHWDPGAIDVTRLTKETTVPAPLPEDHPGARIQRAINANGLQPPLDIDGDPGKVTADGLDTILRYLNGQVASARKIIEINDATITRLAGERDTARANREAAEAEVAQLRKQLQEGGRLPQLLASLDTAAKELEQGANILTAAIAKARA